MSGFLWEQSVLPPLRVNVTARTIIMGTAASRDWQPQHHDATWAVAHSGLPDIIMNNYTMAGWVSRYITDWSGPQGRIGRLSLQMKTPVCPGDELLFSGAMKSAEVMEPDIRWMAIAVELAVSNRVVATAAVRLAVPAVPGAASAWHCPPERWQP